MNPIRPQEDRSQRPADTAAGSPGERVMAHAQAGREVIQDFVALADSLEWQLGQQYLRQRGNKAFLSDASPVPYVTNNDGSLSRNAAEVFFTGLLEAEKARQLQDEIFVLELGIGVGLFARYFLDNLRSLCRQHKKDFYDRLTYIAADRSERMLNDVLRHGVLAEHPGRYRVRQVDAMKPDEMLPQDVCFRNHKGKPFQAVFLNYLLDCLPAAVLEFQDERVRQLCVRTCVARNVRLADYTDLTAQQLRERASSSDPRARDELLEVYGLLASVYDYQPVDLHRVPLGDFAAGYAKQYAKRFLHSYGAIQCLEKLLAMLAPGGFILVNDYGQTQSGHDDDFEHQRFSLATFVGVNFAQLRAYFREGKRCEYIEPAGEEGRGIHARLLAPAKVYEVASRFATQFGEAAYHALQEPIWKARAYAKAERFELAMGLYREALRQQPGNWVLHAEASQFLTFQVGDPKGGADMAKVALALNPTCSAELWNALGDALFMFARTAEARSAYEKALAVNATDVRARYNLAWVHTRERDYPAALVRIAEAFAMDKTGAYRDGLLQKLQEVLARLSQQHRQEYLLLINLVSRAARQDKDKTQEGEEPPPAPMLGDRRD